MDISETILKATRKVTKKWSKQRKAEERHAATQARRYDVLTRCRRLTVKDVAWELMRAAYLKASTDGKYPAHARQIMYAIRGELQKRTSDRLNDQYFCQKLLPDYIAEHPEQTVNWDVVFDARGHFHEPHTGKTVPLGTLPVRKYLNSISEATPTKKRKITLGTEEDRFPTCGPENRFGAILFIEKEGFQPLFEKVHLDQSYDIAIMSTKGLSVTASRHLVDNLCAKYQIPLLVLHDFDKSGFSILGTLRRATRRYTFRHDIQVIDLGLRLADIQTWHLEGEDVYYGKSDPTPNLRMNGTTEEEIEFLCSRRDWQGYSGERVELNAFTSGDLITWIKSKLEEHGVQKLVPQDETLAMAYRRAVETELLKQSLREITPKIRAQASQAVVPKTLSGQILKRLKDNPRLAWDDALVEIVAARLEAPSP
jgi:hypothetical protein